MNRLHIQNISFAIEKRILFQNFDCIINEGNCLWVQGENGSGKSTLLRLIANLIELQEGAVYWQEQRLNKFSSADLIHYQAHCNGLRSGLTVAENLFYYCLINEIDTNKIPELLLRLKLNSLEQKFVKSLSAGQKKRLSLARLFLKPKKIWLLDEPFNALDDAMQNYLALQIQAHLNQKGLVILTSHQHFPVTFSYERVQLS